MAVDRQRVEKVSNRFEGAMEFMTVAFVGGKADLAGR